MRAVRSVVSARSIRSHHGPKSITLPASRTITGNANDWMLPSAGSARATRIAPTIVSAAPTRPRLVNVMPLRASTTALATPTPTGSATCQPPPTATTTAPARMPAPRPSRQLAAASRTIAVGSAISASSVEVITT
jgi:hypothetical protein